MTITKRNILILSFLIAFCPGIHAQNVITQEANIMRNADTIEMQMMEYTYSGDEGCGQLWDFSSVRTLGGSRMTEIHSDSAVNFRKIEGRGIYSYRLNTDSLIMSDYESRLETIHYNVGKLSMRYPLQFGDSIVSYFSGSGTYCGDHKTKVEGQVLLHADGCGTLILSEKDTLKNALRVYTLTTKSIAMDMDSAIIDNSDLKQEIEERYEWYVRGYRYPLYETVIRTSYSNLDPVASTSYAYRLLPGEFTISADSVNDSIRNNDVVKSAMSNTELAGQQHGSTDALFHYTIAMNGNTVSLNYTLDSGGTVNTLVTDVRGIVYRRDSRSSIAGEHVTLSIDCSSLIRDRYVLYMNVNGKIYSEKIAIR